MLELKCQGSIAFVLIAAIIIFLLIRRKGKESSEAIEMRPQQPPQEGEVKDIVIREVIGTGNFSQVSLGIMNVTIL